MDLFSASNLPHTIPLPVDDGEALVVEDFLNPSEATLLFQHLKKSVSWQQATIRIYGKEHVIPREIAWYGDVDRPYIDTGKLTRMSPWTLELTDLKNRIIKMFPDMWFNSVLLNHYRNGNDKVSWHSDDDMAFGRNPAIASLSLGATRRFDFRKKSDKSRVIHINLTSGSLLIMRGAIQHNWEHQVPPQKQTRGERINLTFRKIVEVR